MFAIIIGIIPEAAVVQNTFSRFRGSELIKTVLFSLYINENTKNAESIIKTKLMAPEPP